MSEYIELDLEVIAVTANAVLFHDGESQYWVPRSQIEDGNDIGEADIGTADLFVITEWFALSEGMI